MAAGLPKTVFDYYAIIISFPRGLGHGKVRSESRLTNLPATRVLPSCPTPTSYSLGFSPVVLWMRFESVDQASPCSNNPLYFKLIITAPAWAKRKVGMEDEK